MFFHVAVVVIGSVFKAAEKPRAYAAAETAETPGPSAETAFKASFAPGILFGVIFDGCAWDEDGMQYGDAMRINYVNTW